MADFTVDYKDDEKIYLTDASKLSMQEAFAAKNQSAAHKFVLQDGYVTDENGTKIQNSQGNDITVNEGDSGFKLHQGSSSSSGMIEHHYQMWWNENNYGGVKNFDLSMKDNGTDGIFFGHYHLNSLSVLDPVSNVRWTYGLKTGTYDDSPDDFGYGMGGTLITLSKEDSKDFTVRHIAFSENNMNSVYPKFNYVSPEAEENPNYIFWDKDPLKMIGYEIPSKIKKLGKSEIYFDITGVKIAGSAYEPSQRCTVLGEHRMDYTKKYSYKNIYNETVNTTFTQARNLIIYVRGDANLDDSVSVHDLVRLEHQRLGTKTVDGLAGPRSSDVALNGFTSKSVCCASSTSMIHGDSAEDFNLMKQNMRSVVPMIVKISFYDYR